MSELARRAEIEYALVKADVNKGLGDSRQRRAVEELEWRRCAASPEYFIDMYGHLVLKSGEIIKWELWPIQRALLREWHEGTSTVAVKSRQLGITTLSIHYALWECLFKEAARWFIVSKDEGSAKDAMTRLRATKDRLPKWMTDRAISRTRASSEKQQRKDKADGTTALAFGLSRLEVLTSTPKSVQGKAGKFILDEFAAHTDQERIYHLLLPAFDGGGQAIVIANGDGENAFYYIYQAAKKGDNPFTPHFFYWGDDPTRLAGTVLINEDGTETPVEGVARDVVIHHAAQGRIRSPWYDTTKRAYLLKNPDADEFAFKAQHPSSEEEAFFLHGNSRFEMRVLQKVANAIRDERHEKADKWRTVGYILPTDEEKGEYRFDLDSRGRTRLYEPPVPDALYCVGCDAAGGRNASDYSVAMVGKVLEGPKVEQVCVYQAKVEPTDLGVTAMRLADWYNYALLVPETGSSGHGQAMVNAVKDDYTYIFQQIRTSRWLDEEKEELGFSMNAVTRDGFIADISTWLNTDSLILHDPETVEEMRRFEIDEKSGKAKAPKGRNDDLVIAAGLLIVGAKHLIFERSSTPSVYLPAWS